VERRNLIQAKRQAFNGVFTVANAAQQAIRQELEHPGGWLFPSEDETMIGGNEQRLREMDRLRRTPGCREPSLSTSAPRCMH